MECSFLCLDMAPYDDGEHTDVEPQSINQYLYCLLQINEVSDAQSISRPCHLCYKIIFTVHANQYCNKSSRIVGAINRCQILTHPPYFIHVNRNFYPFIHFFFHSFSTNCCVRRSNFCAGDSLIYCWETEVFTLLFIFHHNDKLQFILLEFTALRSISTMTLLFLPSASLLLKTFSCLQPTQLSTPPLHNHTYTHTHTNTSAQKHDSDK